MSGVTDPRKVRNKKKEQTKNEEKMKNKLFIYVGLAASLLCSCAQSDVDNGQEQGKGQGSTVLHLTATATGGDATRVNVSEDATNGLITKWTNGDKLNVWNLYKGSSGYKMFSTSLSDDAPTADFTCEIIGTTFTPYSSIYAFNDLGTNTYTQNGTGTFTLNLKNYDKQDGTLANMALYDALYGTTTANNDGSKNNSLAMNHLTTAMCFTLTNADFKNNITLKKLIVHCGTSSSSPSTSTTTSILPYSCSATLNAGGELTFGTRYGYSKWTVTGSSIAATAGGVIKVYLMTFPFKNISGPLDFAVETSDGKCYSRAVTMNNLSLNAGTVYNRTVAMKEQTVPKEFAKSNYYCWDACAPVTSGSNSFSTGNYGYNPYPTTSDYDRVAEYSCFCCPSAKEIYAYLLAGAYIDKGDAINMGDGNYSYPSYYTLPNGITYNNYSVGSTSPIGGDDHKGCGLWLPKNSYIKSQGLLNNISGISGTGKGVEDYTGSVDDNNFYSNSKVVNTADLATKIRNSGNYFFLPAAGDYTDGTDSSVSYPGSGGYYWSSSTSTTINNVSAASAYRLAFDSGVVRLSYGFRSSGYLLWGVQ
jgi:hypothetical protein